MVSQVLVLYAQTGVGFVCMVWVCGFVCMVWVCGQGLSVLWVLFVAHPADVEFVDEQVLPTPPRLPQGGSVTRTLSCSSQAKEPCCSCLPAPENNLGPVCPCAQPHTLPATAPANSHTACLLLPLRTATHPAPAHSHPACMLLPATAPSTATQPACCCLLLPLSMATQPACYCPLSMTTRPACYCP